MNAEPTILQSPEHVLSTLERDGSRRWLYPKLAAGRFLMRRRIVAYLLIALFTLLPYTRINGKPTILLDIVSRRFTLLGFTFLPTDMFLLALFAVSMILLVFFVTALLGRIWCGWGCPQTVYMEFVFRPIERLCMGRKGVGGAPKAGVAGWRYAAMYALYAVVSLYLAHTFLAYFVGVDQLRHWMTGSPADHITAFIVVAAITGAMLFNFAYFREQTCTIACPYGRIQSVLLDKQSLIISYDRQRGEPRGPIRKMPLPVVEAATAAKSEAKGDCVACDLCVAVCPTGIDIRQGLQLECIGCAQCIDVCDSVMDKVGRRAGLIRYSSQAAMSGGGQKFLRPRVIIYPLLVTALLGLLAVLIATKSPFDVALLRGLGLPFGVTPSGEVENNMRAKLTNRSDHRQKLTFSIADNASVRVVPATRQVVELGPGESWTESLQVFAPKSAFSAGVLNVRLCVTSDAGDRIERRCTLLGPMTPVAATH